MASGGSQLGSTASAAAFAPVQFAEGLYTPLRYARLTVESSILPAPSVTSIPQPPTLTALPASGTETDFVVHFEKGIMQKVQEQKNKATAKKSELADTAARLAEAKAIKESEEAARKAAEAARLKEEEERRKRMPTSWVCSQCTFENPIAEAKCTICEFARPANAASVSSSAAAAGGGDRAPARTPASTAPVPPTRVTGSLAVSAAAPAPAPAPAPAGWSCPVCTFHNDSAGSSTCSMCGSQKPAGGGRSGV